MSKSRLARAWTILRRRGPGYGFELLIEHGLPKLFFRWRRQRKLLFALGLLFISTFTLILWAIGGARGLISALLLIVFVDLIHRIWHVVGRANTLNAAKRAVREFQPISQPPAGACWASWPVAEETRERIVEARGEHPAEPLVLAKIDNDGRALGLFGELPDLTPITSEHFVERRRFPVELVLAGEHLRVRKTLPGNPAAFWREALPLVRLAEEKSTPTLAEVDEESLTLERYFLRGPTIRDLLVECGAKILSVTTTMDPELKRLPPNERIEAVWKRAYPHLPHALPNGFLDRLEAAMNRLHSLGVTGFSLTYGNIVVEPGEDGAHPVFLDFDNAIWHGRDRGRWAEMRFAHRRDQDREKFRRIYQRKILTEASARHLLASRQGHWYAPIDFGQGLAVGGFWTTESGTGRWEFLNHRVVTPLVAGQRILDLGSNNGVMPLLMLRAGARRVLAVEQDPELIETAGVVQRVFEWRDLKTYDLDFRQADMRFLLKEDPGPFDVITAFCSLYYLEHEDMERMVQRMAELVPLVILQAKDDTRAEAANNKATKSTSTFLARLLRENGFPDVELHSPKDFARPLLIGRRGKAQG